MKKLHLFILKSFSGPLLLTFFIVTFLLQMQFLWKYVDDLVGKGLTFGILSELLLYASATFVPLALPLAILLAALMTFGSLGENYELTAMKSAGISLIRIMNPLIILMVFISISAFFYSNYSLPYFNIKMRSLLFGIQQQRPEVNIKEGVFYNGIEGYSIKIGKRDNSTGLLHHIRIYDHTRNDGNTNVTLADSGIMGMTDDKRTLIITLFRGESYVDMPEDDRPRYPYRRTYPFRRDAFAKQVISVPLEGFDFQKTDEGLFRSNYQMLNLKQLNFYSDSIIRDIKADGRSLKRNLVSYNYYVPTVQRITLPDTLKKADTIKPVRFNSKQFYKEMSNHDKIAAIEFALSEARNAKTTVNQSSMITKENTKKLRRYEIEWNKKFTLSLACLIFFFIGAPLGAIIRKGGLGLPLVISVLFFILYYVITLTGEKMVRESYIPAYIGVWISSYILLPLGAFLTYKATSDSAILNVDSYNKLINKIINLKIWKKLFGKK
jgi:lipopolysaccharide export system permease protein